MKAFTPLHQWILVELEPRQKKSGVIELVTNESNVRVGKVHRLSTELLEKRAGHGLEIGSRVAFLRWNNEHKSGKGVQEVMTRELGENYALVQLRDLLFEVTGDVQVDA